MIDLTERSTYKIGISKNPKKRVKQLQTGNSHKIKLIFFEEVKEAKKAETIIHNFLKDSGNHISGEWFSLTDNQVIVIAKNLLTLEK